MLGAMISLKDWTTYVYLGIVVGAGFGTLGYCVNFDIYKSEDTADKQFNDPEWVTGLWRVGRLPNMGAPVEPGMFVVFKVPRSDGSKTARVVAVAGQTVEVKETEVLVDGVKVADHSRSLKSRLLFPEMVVPRGCVFVLNDLRAKGPSPEFDSRSLGPIPIEAISHCFKPQGKGAS